MKTLDVRTVGFGKMLKTIKKKWIQHTLIAILILISVLKCCQIAYASDSDPWYYGPVCTTYRNLNANCTYTDYILPQGFYCFCVDVSGTQYLCIAFLPDLLYDYNGIYRRRVSYNASGDITSIVESDYMQLLYASNVSVTIDGKQFQIRNMTISQGVILEVPYFKYLPGYITGNSTDERINTISTAFQDYYYGVKSFESGGSVDASIAVDTSNIESLIADSNNINYNTGSTVQAIASDVADIKTQGGSSGVSEDLLRILQRFDVWLIIIMFAVCLTLMRQILHQVSRNIRGI